MNAYRLFLKDTRGRLQQRLELHCLDDNAAIEVAREVATPYRKDLWVETRKVHEFPPAAALLAARSPAAKNHIAR